MEVKTVSLYTCVFVTMMAQSFGSSLFSKHHTKNQHNQHKAISHAKVVSPKAFEKSCECRVELTDGTLIMNFGKITHYKSNSGTCHQLHHKCRIACTGKLNLHAYLPDTTTTHGYHYCDVYGKTTTIIGVQVKAVWETTNCHQKKHQKSRKTSKLCCGHTSLPLTSNKHRVVAKVFGWNPDCRSQTFIVAS